MIATALCVAQLVATVVVEGQGPVRFGLPVEARVLERGLRVDGARGASLQWSLLAPDAPCIGERIWIEVVLTGASGSTRLLLGGVRAADPGQGPLCRFAVERTGDDAAELTRSVWTWADGTVDRRERRLLLAPEPTSSEPREAGEVLRTESAGLASRRARVDVPASVWREQGVLPRADGSGRALREELLATVPRLPRAPGSRGRGDYLRGKEPVVVTNQEFDTTLAFVRLALATGDQDLLERARECAWHLVDVDLDRRSGLPFRHGRDHRDALPELGHVWTSGALLVAATCADRDLLLEVLTIVQSLAARVRAREPRRGTEDRLRDDAWPLFELESSLRYVDHAPVRAACDALAEEIVRRFDPAMRTFRYGEGATRSGEVVRDRLWLTAGILLPALRLHLERRPSRGLADVLDRVESAALEILLDGRDGLALSVMRSARGSFDPVRVEGAAEAVLLLDGLSDPARRRVLARTGLRRALDGVLDQEQDDLATRFSIVGRCAWVIR